MLRYLIASLALASSSALAEGMKLLSLPEGIDNCVDKKCEILRLDVSDTVVEARVLPQLLAAIRLANLDASFVDNLSPSQQTLLGLQVSLVYAARKYEKVSIIVPDQKHCSIKIDETAYRPMKDVFASLVVADVVVPKLSRSQQAFLALFLSSADDCGKQEFINIDENGTGPHPNPTPRR